MSGAFERDRLILQQILNLIDDIDRRLDGMREEDFIADRDETDLTAFRLQVIGEATRKLSDALKMRHPAIEWTAIYGMRNIIAHDYGSIVPTRVWLVATGELEPLKSTCESELKRPF
jgi:uncharacterized protein with HEPN domain